MQANECNKCKQSIPTSPCMAFGTAFESPLGIAIAPEFEIIVGMPFGVAEASVF